MWHKIQKWYKESAQQGQKWYYARVKKPFTNDRGVEFNEGDHVAVTKTWKSGDDVWEVSRAAKHKAKDPQEKEKMIKAVEEAIEELKNNPTETSEEEIKKLIDFKDKYVKNYSSKDAVIEDWERPVAFLPHSEIQQYIESVKDENGKPIRDNHREGIFDKANYREPSKSELKRIKTYFNEQLTGTSNENSLNQKDLLNKFFELNNANNIDEYIASLWNFNINNSWVRSQGVEGNAKGHIARVIQNAAEKLKETENRANWQIKSKEFEDNLARQELVRCQRCGGAGGFNHWPGFTCYDCNGTGAEDPRQMTKSRRELRGLPKDEQELENYLAERRRQAGG